MHWSYCSLALSHQNVVEVNKSTTNCKKYFRNVQQWIFRMKQCTQHWAEINISFIQICKGRGLRMEMIIQWHLNYNGIYDIPRSMFLTLCLGKNTFPRNQFWIYLSKILIARKIMTQKIFVKCFFDVDCEITVKTTFFLNWSKQKLLAHQSVVWLCITKTYTLFNSSAPGDVKTSNGLPIGILQSLRHKGGFAQWLPLLIIFNKIAKNKDLNSLRPSDA